MELAETPENPIPSDPFCGLATTPDGASLRYARWHTDRPPCKGTVLLLHGRAECIEKLFETVSDLRRSGFDVLTFDWRGQGGSSRQLKDKHRGYVEDFKQYVTDLETILDTIALPDCRSPFFILAHSTGGLVSLLAAPRLVNRVERMVLTSPFLGFGPIPISGGVLKFLTGTLCAFGLGSLYLGSGASPEEKKPFTGNRLTSDTRRFARNATFAASNPELSIGGPTAAWLFAAGRAMDEVNDPDFIGSVNIPSLLVMAGSDVVVSNRAIEEMGRRLRSGKMVAIHGARHEILQERDTYREQLLAAFKAFVPGESPARPVRKRKG
ncbi:MAG: alpha/beta hydrolase [Rhizobiaceae bacterium]